MREEVIEQLHLPPKKDDSIDTEELYNKISADLAEYNVLFEALDQIFKVKYSGTEEAIDVDDAKLEAFLELFRTTNHMIKKVIDSFVIISSTKTPVSDGDLEALEFDFKNRQVVVSEVGDEVYGSAGITSHIPSDKTSPEDDEFDDLGNIDLDETGFRDEDTDEEDIDGFDPAAFVTDAVDRDDVDEVTEPEDLDKTKLIVQSSKPASASLEEVKEFQSRLIEYLRNISPHEANPTVAAMIDICDMLLEA